LWFVPTAEVLAHGKWSASGYRRGTNYIQGYTNVADFAGTFAYGIRDRVEVFGSFLVDTRIDRDTRPLFFSNPAHGGIVDRNPRVNQYWTGDHVGDLYVGGKFNLRSEARQNSMALAVRGILKVPTGDDDIGTSTGKPDFAVDFIGSKELAKVAELSGYLGYEGRGVPDGFQAPKGAFRWGGGVGFPTRSPARVTAELNGLIPSSGTVSILGTPLAGIDKSVPPVTTDTEKLTRATVGLTLQLPKGFFFGTGLSWNLPRQTRNTGLTAPDDTDPFADYWDWQFRIGFHPGVRVYVAPPPPAPPPAPPAPAPVAQNRPPTVQAQCNPCTVEIGQNSTVTANAQDPDGDMLTFRWTAPTGMLATPGAQQSVWTAPQQEGPVQVTVTVNDGKGGMASDTVTIQVTRPTPKTYTFEDVHFDFDRYTLRPEATRVLDEAVTALRGDATLRVRIEGHTCNIGTAEYNLALGDRRANAVRDYLVSRGVTADRLSTVSFGEEQPKYDNPGRRHGG